MGVEGSGAVSGSEVRMKRPRVKNESIDVFRGTVGGVVSELSCFARRRLLQLTGSYWLKCRLLRSLLYILWRVLGA